MEHTEPIYSCPACTIITENWTNDCETNPKFWECECHSDDAIKLKELQPDCVRCHMNHEDCADAREHVLQHFGYI